MTEWVDITTMQDEHPLHINVQTGEVVRGGLGGAGTFADQHLVESFAARADAFLDALPGFVAELDAACRPSVPRRLSCVSCGAPAHGDRCGYCGTANA